MVVQESEREIKMNLPLLLASSGFVILFKWTALLALGWLAHWRLRNHHARWRLILWRSLLCFGLVLPLLQFVQIPGIKIPIGSDMDSASESANPASPVTADNPTHPAVSMVHPTQTKVASSPTASRVNSRQLSSPPKQVSWASFLMATWFLGFVFGTIRLVKLQVQLSRLRKQTCQPTLELQRLAARLQIRLNIRREVAVQVSDAVSSPFVCGCSKPMVILPRALVHNLSPDEVSALLSHELAHLRQNDLVWCVAWRWMKAACWFHPLVWNIPAAHNLACEQEADRVASEKFPDPTSYARLLARLALRVLR